MTERRIFARGKFRRCKLCRRGTRRCRRNFGARTEHVNRPQSEAELEAIRRSVVRGQPFGGEAWQRKVVRQLGLEHTFRPRGRPRLSDQQPDQK